MTQINKNLKKSGSGISKKEIRKINKKFYAQHSHYLPSFLIQFLKKLYKKLFKKENKDEPKTEREIFEEELHNPKTFIERLEYNIIATAVDGFIYFMTFLFFRFILGYTV